LREDEIETWTKEKGSLKQWRNVNGTEMLRALGVYDGAYIG
jgi:hypothetical protein